MIRRALSKLRGKELSAGAKGGEMVMKKTEAKKTKKRSISKDELFGLIEKEAYNFFSERGCTHGNDLEDWLRAERIVKEKFGVR